MDDKERRRFERRLQDDLAAFQQAAEIPTRHARRHVPSPSVSGFVVQLAVRESRLSPDVLFTHDTHKVSRLEAQIDAERAARAAGYPILGYVVEIARR